MPFPPVTVLRVPKPRFLLIEIGSRASKVAITEPDLVRPVREVFYKSEFNGLGTALKENGSLLFREKPTLIDLMRSLSEARDTGKLDNVRAGKIVATAAMRYSPDGAELFQQLANALRISVLPMYGVHDAPSFSAEIIDGETEARMTYLAVQSSVRMVGTNIVANIGGASAELIAGTSQKYLDSKSVPIQDNFRRNNYYPTRAWTSQEFNDAVENMAEQLRPALEAMEPFRSPYLIISSGTPRRLLEIAASGKDRTPVETFSMAREEVDQFVYDVWRHGEGDRYERLGMTRETARLAPYGAVALTALMESLDTSVVKVSPWSMRYGFAVEAFQQSRELISGNTTSTTSPTMV